MSLLLLDAGLTRDGCPSPVYINVEKGLARWHRTVPSKFFQGNALQPVEVEAASSWGEILTLMKKKGYSVTSWSQAIRTFHMKYTDGH